jgi:hypothetical protein
MFEFTITGMRAIERSLFIGILRLKIGAQPVATANACNAHAACHG